MLRLVHPAPQGQALAPSSRRKWAGCPALSLTWEESRHVRAAITNIARTYGGLDVLAVVLGMGVKTLYTLRKPRHRVSGTFAIRLASAAGMSVEAILSGTMANAARCPACGHRAAAGGAR
jgi:hypothetical protein